MVIEFLKLQTSQTYAAIRTSIKARNVAGDSYSVSLLDPYVAKEAPDVYVSGYVRTCCEEV